MNHFITALQQTIVSMQGNMSILLTLILGLWLLHIVNWALGYQLNTLGLYPRKLHGLIGIVTSPFLHGNFNHLFFNSIILFVLANFVLLGGVEVFYSVSLIIILLSGIALWLMGRSAFHIGASSLITGYWGYLLASAYYQRTGITIILASATLYYFGSLFFSLFPDEEKISWEGHLFGCLAGVSAAWLYYHPDILQQLTQFIW